MDLHLTRKQEMLLRTAGMTLAVYLIFKYLLPLFLPFLAAILLSIPIRPAARFFYKKLHVPIGLAAGVLLALLCGVLALLLYWLGKSALDQLILLSGQLPDLWSACCDWLLDCCSQVEQGLRLSRGTISAQMIRFTDMGADGLGMKTLSGFLDGLMNTSFQGVRVAAELLVTVFVTIGATLITTTQLEELKRARDRSVFREEIVRITGILARVGAAYGKTELMIMLLTMAVCAAGLTIMGNSYALLVGILLGFLDALPLFGVSTVLWPWIAVSAFSGNLRQTVGLAVIYAVCSLIRELMEARYMGDRIGLNALENLISMYVGMQLFGLLGLFLGPIGYLLIKEAGSS
ncbi:MAG: AI-2E family transporter [Lachnospiraceae bacterium]|nr:AI-2E family transporter [Lachnospiraceae bacterium]